jgi:hypothetical protein
MRLMRTLPDYNRATRPILLHVCQRVIVEEDVLVIEGLGSRTDGEEENGAGPTAS